jgi:ubiquinone biosynthesis monooxygenase Coq7
MAYDISIIRPEVRLADVKLRGEGSSPEASRKIKPALRALTNLELMAQTIYRYELTAERSEFTRQLIAALLNEMGHFQDFQVKVYEYGWFPGIIRFGYWWVGWFFGVSSRLRGRRAMLKTNIWLEEKAVRHYTEFLKWDVWDADTRRVLEKDLADEVGHVERWRNFLVEMK